MTNGEESRSSRAKAEGSHYVTLKFAPRDPSTSLGMTAVLSQSRREFGRIARS
jgi:hypothetical protein